MGKTNIEWADYTHNPWYGCKRVGPACQHCYAAVWGKRSNLMPEWGAPRIQTSEKNRKEPIRWNSAAAAAGRIDTVFSCSLGDIWDNEVDPVWRAEFLLDIVAVTPSLLWLLLSKRIGNAVKMCEHLGISFDNIALGATMVTQEEWDRDIPKLKFAQAELRPKFTFVSVEPMIEPITMTGPAPGWVICGGETGSGDSRWMNPAWARSLRDQCAARGVPFFLKQMTKKAPVPPDLRIRQYAHEKDDDAWA